MSAIDDLTTVPAQPEISEGNKTFSQKTYALYVWIRTKLVPAMVELRDLIVNAITGSFTGVSSNSITITDTGEVSLNTDAGRSFKPGTPVRLAYVTDPRNYIDGITKTYDSSSGAFVFYALAKAGSGTYTNWSLTIIPSGGGLAGLGSNTFTGAQYVPDDAYDATAWNGSSAVPTKNAIRDAIVSLLSLIPSIENLTSDSGLTSNAADKGASPQWVRAFMPVKAWVNFNGTGTVSIRSSKNVTSITDNGVGDYTVNFTNPITDANYVASINGGNDAVSVSSGNVFWGSHHTKTTTSFRFVCGIWGGGSSTRVATDFDQVNVAIFR